MGKSFYAFIFIFYSLVCTGADSLDRESRDNAQKRSLKILTYNVRNCVGLDKLTDYQRIADIIKRLDADVVALQELDSATSRSKNIVVLNELAARTNLFPSYSASIGFQGGKYGIGVLTREKPVSRCVIGLPGKEEKRSLLIVELKDFVLCCTHLSLTREDRLASVEIINQAVDKYSKPVFLAGDLNTEPGSAELKSLEKTWTMLNDPNMLTFPANNPDKCIDYIMVHKKDKFCVNAIETKVGPESVASDHRPVWVNFKLIKNQK